MARLLCAGCTGLIGGRLLAALRARGDELLVLSRDPEAARRRLALDDGVAVARWDARRDPVDPAWCRERDAIVDLCGAGIADRRWSAARKRELRHSRVDARRSLAAAAEVAGVPAFIAASGVGIYPPGTTPADEDAAPGDGFLARLCLDWEAASRAYAGRSVQLRIGVVFSPDGGALRKLVPRLGPLAWLGSGRQAFPWIHVDDLVALLLAALDDPAWSGPVNAVAPGPVDLRTVITAAGRVTGRWRLPVGVPGWALRLALGELAGMLLSGRPVEPAMARRRGFTWRHADLESALESCLLPAGD